MVLALTMALVGPANYHIEGDGWFRFRREGRAVYANRAELVSRDGRIETASGLPLWPEVSVHGTDFVVAPDGTVTCGGVQTGTVVLAYFESAPLFGEDGLASSPDRPSLTRVRTGTRIVSEETSTAPRVRILSSPAAEARAALPPAPVEAPQSITLRLTAEVDGPAVTLQDLVEEALPTELANLVVTTAPPIGARMTLDSGRVEAKVRASGLMPEGWSGLGSRMTIQVVRSTNAVPHSKLVGAAAAGLAAQDSGEWIASDNPGDFSAPKGRVELRSERAAISGNTATVVIAVYVDGIRFNSRTVRLQRKSLPNMPSKGAVVPLRMIAGIVVVESRGTVTAVDIVTGDVTLKLDTGAVVTGRMAADGCVEVRR
ncbi:MAG: hypothetical protein AB7F50_11085 [Fimbriimonadaceae bacterium]